MRNKVAKRLRRQLAATGIPLDHALYGTKRRDGSVEAVNQYRRLMNPIKKQWKKTHRR